MTRLLLLKPLGIDIFDGVQTALDGFVYNVAFSLAGIHWSLLRAFIMMGHIIERINLWLTEQAFAPLIAANTNGLSTAFTLAFVVALFVLGITYMIAVFVRLNVVNLQSALTWYIAGALFFALGPSAYRAMNDFRQDVAGAFYLSTLDGIQARAGDTFDLGAVQSADLGLAPLCDYLGAYLPDAHWSSTDTINGLDVTLAFLHADGVDLMGYYYPIGYPPGCPVHLRDPRNAQDVSTIPTAWFYEEGYFEFNLSPDTDAWSEDAIRAEAIGRGWQSHGRMLTAWPLVLFGIIEQTVGLLLTIAMGVTFMIFGVAVLFGFFRHTEAIAQSVVNQWIELVVQTVIIGMVQALVVGFFLLGTAAGNALVVLAVGLVCLLLMVIVLWSGVKAVWNSLNRLFDAFSRGAGQVFVRPGQAATASSAVAGTALTTTAQQSSAALSGLNAMRQSAIVGGSQALVGAARTFSRGRAVPQEIERVGEELEQHISGVMRSPRPLAHDPTMAQTLAGALRLLRVEGYAGRIDAPTARQYLGASASRFSVQELAQMGTFLNHAHRMGITPQQAGQVVQSVQAAPDGQLQTGLRDTLTQVVSAAQGIPPKAAQQQVVQLAIHAGKLPADDYATATQKAAVMSGSEAVIHER